MLFRRLFLCALFVGLLTGLFDSVVQRWQVVPLILAAEVFEEAGNAPAPVAPAPVAVPAPAAAQAAVHRHADGAQHIHEAAQPAVTPAPAVAAPAKADAHAEGAAHSHDESTWEPENGLERSAYTVLANVLNAIGLALLLMPLLALWNRHRAGQPLALNNGYGAIVRYGLLWGAAGWFCLFALPSLGQPPELPGMQAADLQARQIWWSLTVACSAGALALLCLVKAHWRWLGLALLALPFAIGAPEHAGSAFAGMDAEVALQMQQLATRFVVATALASALQWLLLGTLSALAVARWLSPLLNPVAAATPLEGAAS
jgi:cobalt transporter subunit CbtA